MWREGPLRNGASMRLCNACGIRWQKYATYCVGCTYIPRKQEKARGVCPHCQVALPPAIVSKRKGAVQRR